MDPVCHTLVGVALAKSGLGRRSRWGAATLVIGANAPDIDVVSLAWGSVTGLSFRRGWTHGVLAMLVLPLLLTAGMILIDRLRRARGRHVGDLRPLRLLWLAGVAVGTHPCLDFLNVYGMRFFMPFVDRWQYGDVLFIVDPWMWAILSGGIYATSRATRHGGSRPEWGARNGLMVALLYVGLMGGGTAAARYLVRSELRRVYVAPPRFMAAPVPVNPFKRYVVIDGATAYRFGSVNFLRRPVFTLDVSTVPKGFGVAAQRAARTRNGAAFLHWARFPFFEVRRNPEAIVVDLIDARYALTSSARFGAFRVVLPMADSGGADGMAAGDPRQ